MKILIIDCDRARSESLVASVTQPCALHLLKCYSSPVDAKGCIEYSHGVHKRSINDQVNFYFLLWYVFYRYFHYCL